MAISVREVLQGIAVGGDLDLTTGVGTAATDLLVVTHSTHFYTLADMDPPTPGVWTLATQADDGDNRVKTKVWVRAAGSAGAQTITIPPVNDTHSFGRLRVLAGADTTDPVDAAGGANGFGPQAAPSVAPSTADAFLCCDWIGDDEFNYTAPPTGMTASGTQLQDFSTTYGAHQQLAGSGATGTRTPTTSANVSWAATSVAITTAAGAVEEQIGAAAEADASRPVAAAKQATLAAAAEADQAHPLTATRQAAVAPAAERDTALPTAAAKATPVEPAPEVDSANALTVGKTAGLTAGHEADTALPLTLADQPRQLGVAAAFDAARPIRAARICAIGAARETNRANGVTAGKTATLQAAIELDAAPPVTGPAVVVTPGILTPGSIRPTLTPGAARPTLTAGAIRPVLTPGRLPSG